MLEVGEWDCLVPVFNDCMYVYIGMSDWAYLVPVINSVYVYIGISVCGCLVPVFN